MFAQRYVLHLELSKLIAMRAAERAVAVRLVIMDADHRLIDWLPMLVEHGAGDGPVASLGAGCGCDEQER